MNIQNIMSKFLRQDPLPHHSREDFHSDTNYAAYHLMHKIEYHRRLIKKLNSHRDDITDPDLKSDHIDAVMLLKVKIMGYEDQLLRILKKLGARSYHVNAFGEIVGGDVPKEIIQQAMTPVEDDMPDKIKQLTEQPIAFVSSDNVNDIFALMEWDKKQREKTNKTP